MSDNGCVQGAPFEPTTKKSISLFWAHVFGGVATPKRILQPFYGEYKKGNRFGGTATKVERLNAKATEERKHMVGKLGEVPFKSEREGRITPSTGLSFPVERVVM
jgi:hypothetical protein